MRERKAVYDATLAAWKEQCVTLRVQGVKAKDLPQKPLLRDQKVAENDSDVARRSGQVENPGDTDNLEAHIDDIADESQTDDE
jgi:hypothetical protein